MRRIFFRGLLCCSAGALAAAAMAFSFSSAFAAEAGTDDHCFPGGKRHTVLYAEDLYANGELSNPGEIAELKALTERQWRLRLTGLPFEAAKQDRRDHREYHRKEGHGSHHKGHHHHGYYYGYYWGWYSPYWASYYERADERSRRRTGSKYIYVTPEMKDLARSRAKIRSLKRKPCNPSITYLPTN